MYPRRLVLPMLQLIDKAFAFTRFGLFDGSFSSVMVKQTNILYVNGCTAAVVISPNGVHATISCQRLNFMTPANFCRCISQVVQEGFLRVPGSSCCRGEESDVRTLRWRNHTLYVCTHLCSFHWPSSCMHVVELLAIPPGYQFIWGRSTRTRNGQKVCHHWVL